MAITPSKRSGTLSGLRTLFGSGKSHSQDAIVLEDLEREGLFVPGTSPSLDQLKNSTIEGEFEYSFGKAKKLDQHLLMLRSEFVGRSELEFFHACTIVFIRRDLAPAESKANFWRLWDQETEFLLQHLDSRWLISACDTMADISEDQETRLAAIAGSLFANTCKLYETERHATQQEQMTADAQGDERIALYDGLSAFKIGEGDMVLNLFERLERLDNQNAATRILKELVERAKAHDTVFQRLRTLHTNEKTQW